MSTESKDFSSRHSRAINPRAYLEVNVPAILIAIFTYLLWAAFFNADPVQVLCWQNIALAYVVSSIRCYIYVIVLYFKFAKRRKYFTELHAKMESERTFIGHVATCCMRTSFSASIMAILNILGMFYFYGVREEFGEEYALPFTPYGCAKKLVLFTLEMFVWEIWYDFGHYWGHRMAHHYKWLYDLGHCKHHENVCPDAWDGFNITLDDAILTNWIPHMFSLFITTKLIFRGRPFSLFEYHVLESYKAFVEVTGHVGVDFKGHSFPMFPPLAYYTGIDIGTAAYHSLHHRYYTCNFTKRFTLWDRVFGTMRVPPVFSKSVDEKKKAQLIRETFKN